MFLNEERLHYDVPSHVSKYRWRWVFSFYSHFAFLQQIASSSFCMFNLSADVATPAVVSLELTTNEWQCFVNVSLSWWRHDELVATAVWPCKRIGHPPRVSFDVHHQLVVQCKQRLQGRVGVARPELQSESYNEPHRAILSTSPQCDVTKWCRISLWSLSGPSEVLKTFVFVRWDEQN